MPIVKDRVRETSTSTGTGNLALGGAVAQFQSFNTAYGTSAYFYYCIEDGNGTGWETGRGYLSGATTLVRDLVHDGSSGAGTTISLSTNTHRVFSASISELFDDQISRGYMMSRGAYTP